MLASTALVEEIRCQVVERGWYRAPLNIGTTTDIDSNQVLRSLALTLSGQQPPEITDVQFTREGTAEYLANSQASMSLHSDHIYLGTPCDLVILFCIRPAEAGGETLLSDGQEAVAELPWAIVSLLSEAKWVWTNPRRLGGGLCPPRAVVSAGKSIRWWRRGLTNKSIEQENVADEFDAALHRSDNLHMISLREHELLVMDNRRILHGRRAFEGQQRLLVRARVWE